MRAANHAERFTRLERVVGLERAAVAVWLAQAGVTAAGQVDARKVVVRADVDSGETQLLRIVLIDARAINSAPEAREAKLDVVDDRWRDYQVMRYTRPVIVVRRERRLGCRAGNGDFVRARARWVHLRLVIAIVINADAVGIREAVVELDVVLVFIDIAATGRDIVRKQRGAGRKRQHRQNVLGDFRDPVRWDNVSGKGLARDSGGGEDRSVRVVDNCVGAREIARAEIAGGKLARVLGALCRKRYPP